jgi:hypothetical protein
MLAWRMEDAHEDGAERVRVLHIHPEDNRWLRKVTSSAFADLDGAYYDDAFKAFQAAIAPAPDGEPRFFSRTTDQVFRPLIVESLGDGWADYLLGRYPSIITPEGFTVGEA